MAFEIHGELAALCFEPRFAPLHRFFSAVSAGTGHDVHLIEIDGAGYSLTIAGFGTCGERYLHLAWKHLNYWAINGGSPELLLPYVFSEELIALSAALPAFTIIGTRGA